MVMVRHSVSAVKICVNNGRMRLIEFGALLETVSTTYYSLKHVKMEPNNALTSQAINANMILAHFASIANMSA